MTEPIAKKWERSFCISILITLCLYFSKAALALGTSKFSSVSSLKETT